ncbi:MAG: LamG-like jellyroll fold domain-containing protein [Steroidobacteraceae bacterium]
MAIPSLSWDLSTVTSLRKAMGSDIWAMTWGADGNLYGAWGDGGGFDGTQDSKATGRTSVGFARIAGTPVVGNPSSFVGKNVWGQAPQFALSQATFGGKVSDLFSVGGVLYGQGALWTSANCGCTDPTIKSGNNPADYTLVWSSDLGKTWTTAPWKSSGGFGSFLQFGQDYEGAFDPQHLYFYYVGDVNSDPTHSYLRRMLTSAVTADPSTPGHWEYFTGLDSSGSPIWSTIKANAHPVFTDVNSPAGAGTYVGVVYDAPLGRYVAIAGHGDGVGQMGIFEAPNPWGPWATVGYYADWGGFNETAGPSNGMQFPAKWISSDGKTLWAVFSGINTFDSFNIAKVVLTTSKSLPQISAPAIGTAFSPGERVTAQGSGTGLSWTISRLGLNEPALASGSGTTFQFAVPTDCMPNVPIRIELHGSMGSIYRDYPVTCTTPIPSTPVAYWAFDEGSGSITADRTGGGHSGTLVNGPTWVSGQIGAHAISLDGQRNEITVSGAGSLANLHNTGMTVSVWIKPAGAGGGGLGRILDKDNNDVGWFLAMSSTSTVKFTSDQEAQGNATRTSTPSIALNRWQHVALTWDGSAKGSNAHIYINGTLSDGASTDGIGPEQNDSGTPLTIGNRALDLARGFAGAIDDVRIFNRTLTADEIRALGETQSGSTPSVSIASVSTGKPYVVTSAQVGATAYIDRAYTLTGLSSELAGGRMVQGSNDDKIVTDANYLTLTVGQPATLSVCYSTLATQLPAWLTDGSWSPTSDVCAFNDGVSGSRIVYQRRVGAGKVTLGGNRESPASGSNAYSNYVVIVTP